MMLKLVDPTPPPGVGFTTSTTTEPKEHTSAPGTVAVRVLALQKVVANGVPAKRITELLMKSDPLTVRVKGPLCTATDAGFAPVTVGAGFNGAVTVKVLLELVPPPGAGLNT